MTTLRITFKSGAVVEAPAYEVKWNGRQLSYRQDNDTPHQLLYINLDDTSAIEVLADASGDTEPGGKAE